MSELEITIVFARGKVDQRTGRPLVGSALLLILRDERSHTPRMAPPPTAPVVGAPSVDGADTSDKRSNLDKLAVSPLSKIPSASRAHPTPSRERAGCSPIFIDRKPPAAID